jgi:small subunit ribosomal protein S21
MSQDTIKVVIDEQHGVEKALKKFKRLCESYGVIREYKKRQAYTKPSVCLKEKLEIAEKRRRKAEMKQMRTGEKI